MKHLYVIVYQVVVQYPVEINLATTRSGSAELEDSAKLYICCIK